MRVYGPVNFLYLYTMLAMNPIPMGMQICQCCPGNRHTQLVSQALDMQTEGNKKVYNGRFVKIEASLMRMRPRP